MLQQIFVDMLRQQALERDEQMEGGGMEEVSSLALEFYQSLRKHLETVPIHQGT